MEIEAKFRIPGEQAFRRLLEVAALAGFGLGDVSVMDLHDRYLDTADWAIRAQGYACRVRHSGDRYLATLKGLGGAVGAVHRRVEYQVELPGPLSPRDWPPGSARDLALRLCEDKPLVGLFEIEQVRHSRLLYDRGCAVAEVSLDRITVCHGRSRQPIAGYLELEAELLPGSSEESLKKLVTEIEDVWGLRPESRSKYERGLEALRQAQAIPEM